VLLPRSEHRNRISRYDEGTRWLYCSSGKLALQFGPVNYLYSPPWFCVHHRIFCVHQKHISYSPHSPPPKHPDSAIEPLLCTVTFSTAYKHKMYNKLYDKSVVFSCYWLYMLCFWTVISITILLQYNGIARINLSYVAEQIEA